MRALAALLMLLAAVAVGDEPDFTATRFAYLVRFEADGVVSLQVSVYDLADTRL